MTIDTATRHQGVVKWFGGRLGNFGFIKPNDGSEEMFVHISAFGKAGLREIKEGDRLEYSVEIDKKNGRPCAVDLKLI